MKGLKAYNLAMSIHEKLYGNRVSFEQQKILYAQYLKFLKKAAYQGHIESLYDMGNHYDDIGYFGIPNPMHNPKEYAFWYTKACQKGHPEAFNNLASLYESGRGVEKNFAKALDLYEQSAKLGSPNGRKNYKLMLRDMSKGGKYHR